MFRPACAVLLSFGFAAANGIPSLAPPAHWTGRADRFQEPAGDSQPPAVQSPPPQNPGDHAADVVPDDSHPDAEGRLLFDGRSLDNWRITGFGSSAPVSVVDGCLELGTGSPLCGVTWAGGELPVAGYEIRLEAQRVQGIDFFCCLTFPVGDSHCSLVVGGWAGTVVGLSSIDGEDASTNATSRVMAFETGRWYPISVTVSEDEIVATIDGEEVIRQPVEGHQFSVRNEVRLSRPLGICSFETVARIRDIRLLIPQPGGDR